MFESLTMDDLSRSEAAAYRSSAILMPRGQARRERAGGYVAQTGIARSSFLIQRSIDIVHRWDTRDTKSS